MRHSSDLLKGALAGVAAGLIASWASTQFQAVWNAAQKNLTGEKAEGGETQDDPPTVKAADQVSEAVAGTPVPEPHREQAGELVHYVTGAGLGGLYGLLGEAAPVVTAGYGTGFSMAANLLLNEALVPVLRLGPPPTETPLVKHLYGAATHLVFGLALEGSRRAIRQAL